MQRTFPPSSQGPKVHLTREDQAFPGVDVVTIKIHLGTEKGLPGIKQRAELNSHRGTIEPRRQMDFGLRLNQVSVDYLDLRGKGWEEREGERERESGRGRGRGNREGREHGGRTRKARWLSKNPLPSRTSQL